MSGTTLGTGTDPLPAIGALYVGSVMHARMKPVAHRFTYRVFSMLINLDQLPALDAVSAFFSVDRFNLFSFYPSDHGPRDGSSLALYARALLEEAGMHETVSHVYLLCYPRMLGYAFNPLSVYFAYGADQSLLGVIYEVRNTFKEHHTYVATIRPGELTVSGLRQERKKQFYVSPFNDLALRYLFRLHPPDDKITVRILVKDEKGPLLSAAFSGQKSSLSTSGLIAQFLTIPLMTIKIIAGIHVEALRLWLKGLRMVKRPKPPVPVSFGDATDDQ